MVLLDKSVLIISPYRLVRGKQRYQTALACRRREEKDKTSLHIGLLLSPGRTE